MPSLVLVPCWNAYISSGKPDISFASSNLLYAGVNPHGFIYRSLMYVDLHMLPADMAVDSAILRMYADHSLSKSGTARIAPVIAATAWNEADVTWNSQPGLNPSVTGSTANVFEGGWYSWDVTNLMNMWLLDRSNNFGFAMKSAEETGTDLKSFYSAKHGYARNRPSIEVKYNRKEDLCIGSRSTASVSETYSSENEQGFSSWQNTSTYSLYTFFVQNTGRNPVQLSVQVSPDRSAVFQEAACYILAPGSTEAVVPQRFGYYTRIAFKSCFANRYSHIKIWFQAQV